tara:strand:+ start:150 stop:362 length:213 start_codon:yes stop_codon:yes gene_type:complete
MYNFDIDILKWSIDKLYGIDINSLLNKLNIDNIINVKIVDNIYIDIEGNKYNIINGKIGKTLKIKDCVYK